MGSETLKHCSFGLTAANLLLSILFSNKCQQRGHTDCEELSRTPGSRTATLHLMSASSGHA